MEKKAILKNHTRRIEKPKENDQELGPLRLLPGMWKNLPSLPGRGWNMIALPFRTEPIPNPNPPPPPSP